VKEEAEMTMSVPMDPEPDLEPTIEDDDGAPDREETPVEPGGAGILRKDVEAEAEAVPESGGEA
jgi:hypothetical protein